MKTLEEEKIENTKNSYAMLFVLILGAILLVVILFMSGRSQPHEIIRPDVPTIEPTRVEPSISEPEATGSVNIIVE